MYLQKLCKLCLLFLDMIQHCQNCLSIAACTTHTPHVLHLSGSFQFNKQLIDGNCMVKDENGSIGCVPHLPVNISINERVNLSSIYIHCPICGSSYTLNYYLISKCCSHVYNLVHTECSLGLSTLCF